MWFFKKDRNAKKDSPESQLKAAAAYSKEGDDFIRRHEFAKAEECYLKSVAILEPLIRQNESTALLRELSRVYSMLSIPGRMTTDEKKRREAAEWLKKSVEIDEKLAEQAGTPQAYDDLACSYSGLGGTALDVTWCEKALEIWQELHRQFPNEPLYAKRIADEQENIKKLEAYLARQS